MRPPSGAALTVVAAAAGLALWGLSLGAIHAYSSGPAGLIGELPILWWLSLVVVTASFVGAITRRRPSTFAAAFSLSALVIIFAATAQAAESTSRFAQAYVTAGFSEYIGRTGHVLPDFDARFYWPGFFAAVGMASRAMGVPTTWFIRWAPVVFNLSYLFPLKALANGALRSERARWAALGLFSVGNWVGQDHLSPQALALFLYRAVLAVTVRIFGDSPLEMSTPVLAGIRRTGATVAATVLRSVMLWTATIHPPSPDRSPPG